jgi:hypothetical protein
MRYRVDVTQGGCLESFLRLQEAYAALSDDNQRIDYDRQRGYVKAPPPPPQHPWWLPVVHFPGMQVKSDGFNVFIQFG